MFVLQLRLNYVINTCFALPILNVKDQMIKCIGMLFDKSLKDNTDVTNEGDKLENWLGKTTRAINEKKIYKSKDQTLVIYKGFCGH